ncbi:hypothetical protein CRG98_008700 [Punica granatum]|uniref:Uncharacterized protein n=1 Tax=Punica granatum TaxID=22663 RepID=A0A2I0KQX8_PUNGR|nr:hypothetical protein CRG98_008700 [Punica granatum]
MVDPVKRKWMKRGLCTVVWLSDRDHLFMGESEGCEGPFERDGTTRQSRGRKWQVWRTRMRRRNRLGTRWCLQLERGVGGFKSKIQAWKWT